MQNRFQCFAALAAFGILALGPAMAQSNQGANRLTTGDTTFATKAAQGGIAEVQTAQLAQQRSSNQDVKNFAQRMIDDHTKANDELKSIAEKDGLTLPTAMDAKQQATYDRLSKLNGAQFDRQYITDEIADHRNDINEFQHEASSGSNPQVKDWAQKTLPTLREHLSLAEKTQANVKK